MFVYASKIATMKRERIKYCNVIYVFGGGPTTGPCRDLEVGSKNAQIFYRFCNLLEHRIKSKEGGANVRGHCMPSRCSVILSFKTFHHKSGQQLGIRM